MNQSGKLLGSNTCLKYVKVSFIQLPQLISAVSSFIQVIFSKNNFFIVLSTEL